MQLLSADGLLIWLGKGWGSKTNATITEGSVIKMVFVTVNTTGGYAKKIPLFS